MQKPLRVCLAIVNLPPVIIKGHVKNSLFLLRKWKKDMPTFTTSYQAQRWIFCSYFNWAALLQLRLPFCSTNAKRSELMQYHFICLQYLHWSFPDPTIASKCEKKTSKKKDHTPYLNNPWRMRSILLMNRIAHFYTYVDARMLTGWHSHENTYGQRFSFPRMRLRTIKLTCTKSFSCSWARCSLHFYQFTYGQQLKSSTLLTESKAEIGRHYLWRPCVPPFRLLITSCTSSNAFLLPLTRFMSSE